MNFFESYANVAMESDNVTFYQCKIIKVTSGFNLKKIHFFTRWRQHPQNSWNIFQIQITPLFRPPQDPHGCLEKQNHPLSLNLVIRSTKIGHKTKKLWKTIKKLMTFFGQFWVFTTFLVLGPILANHTTKFQLSGWICFSRYPWESWGHKWSGTRIN